MGLDAVNIMYPNLCAILVIVLVAMALMLTDSNTERLALVSVMRKHRALACNQVCRSSSAFKTGNGENLLQKNTESTVNLEGT